MDSRVVANKETVWHLMHRTMSRTTMMPLGSHTGHGFNLT